MEDIVWVNRGEGELFVRREEDTATQSNLLSHLRVRFFPPLVLLHETKILLDFYDKFLRL